MEMVGGGGQNELRHYIVSGLVTRNKQTKKKGHSQLTIATHLTDYTFIDKVHKNP